MAQYIIPAIAAVVVAVIEAIAAAERRQEKKNRKLAEEINEEAKRMSGEGVLRCKKIYERILETLV